MTTSNNISLETLAKLLDLTPRRIQQLANEGVLIKKSRGQYEFLSSLKGYISYLHKQMFPQGKIDYQHEKARLAKLQADREEILLTKLKSELIEVDLAEKLFVQLASTIRQKLLSLPTQLAGQLIDGLSPHEKQHLLYDAVCQILNELHTFTFAIETLTDSGEDTTGVTTAAESESMGG